jgi:type 1 glutamine amidotransferase
LEQFDTSEHLGSLIKKRDWNEYDIVAKGNHISQKINGHLMCELTDEDSVARKDGIIALQLHAGEPMRVEFRNVRLKLLPKEASSMKDDGKKKIVFVAGKPSHGYGEHEHNAGCTLLAKCLNDNVPGVEAVVYKNGWPADPAAFDGASAVVFYADGGDGHPAMGHLAELQKLVDKGVGVACIHYAVEIPPGTPGNLLKSWIGGYFETFWSVNPFWKAEFKQLPKHPVANGVKPFTIEDEWYYHMRFADDARNLTPILTALPPDSTRREGNDAHGANAHVRARKGMVEDVAWAYQRPGGGRGFGFTGGHLHWNWANNNFRKVVLNGIVWTAGMEVPAEGVNSKAPTFRQLDSNLDKPKPADFDSKRFKTLVEKWEKEAGE